MAAVDRSSPMPVYFQIALDLRRRIGAGEWRPGERIAPELQLVRDYAVSRVTVRQALAELVKDDLVERHRGSGTYVREQQHPLVYDLNLTVGVMATRLREAGLDNRATVVDARVLDDPPQELKLRLQIPAGGSVVHLVRVILINEEPTAVYRSWFDAARVPGLEHARRPRRIALGGADRAVRPRPRARRQLTRGRALHARGRRAAQLGP